MPKRPFPFEEDSFVPQLKLHVREKEVNSGVARNINMKRVYDKTMSMLFAGARIVGSETPSAEPALQNISPTQPSSTLHQRILDSNCQLLHSSLKPVAPEQILCSLCKDPSLENVIHCSFCERPLCESCTLPCMKCSDSFCSACSFNVYDRNEGESICRNCC